MSETSISILIGTAGLSVAATIALILTIARGGKIENHRERSRFVLLFLAGVALQAVHFVEELGTGFHAKFPETLGLAAWPTEFFVGFNLFWMAVWLISAWGILRGARAALFPVWFFILAMIVNGIAHPALAARVWGYFPGLATAVPVGILGLVIGRRLWRLTESEQRTTTISQA